MAGEGEDRGGDGRRRGRGKMRDWWAECGMTMWVFSAGSLAEVPRYCTKLHTAPRSSTYPASPFSLQFPRAKFTVGKSGEWSITWDGREPLIIIGLGYKYWSFVHSMMLNVLQILACDKVNWPNQ